MFLHFCFVHFFLQGTSGFHTHGDDTFIYLFIFTTTRTHTRNPSFPDGLAECHISYLAVSYLVSITTLNMMGPTKLLDRPYFDLHF